MAAFALLLLGYGAFVAVLGRETAIEQEQETQQRLSRGLAQHIVEHWPLVTAAEGNGRAAIDELLRMLMVVNPAIQVYLLDADGRVGAYVGDPALVRTQQVDLAPVRAFLAGAALPLVGTDPMGGDAPRIFSAAMFPPRPGDTRPPGYLYVVLQNQARAAVAGSLSQWPAWQRAAWAAAIGLLATLAIGVLVLRRLTLPLARLARRMRDFRLDGGTESHGSTKIGIASNEAAPTEPAATEAATRPRGDEVAMLAASFNAMARRITEQAASREAQAAAHREVMANVAHDLRTPLTALHGHLEALDAAADDVERRHRLVATALAQSDKVRRLSQQLFELATLQAIDHVLQHERFRYDELVADTVQKFEFASPRPSVALAGPPPGAVDFEGDLHLIERALTNLIDNAVRHAPGTEPVRVSLQCEAAQVTVWVEDRGPGLPAELARRLDAGQPLREPPLQRPGGGIGGLGLAIAQRIAALHGGSLRTLPSQDGGTRLAFALPRVQPR
jgi:signal transduction histidine kinase